MGLGNYAVLEKGPLVILLGGPDLMDHDKLQKTSSEKNYPLIGLIVICILFQTLLAFFKSNMLQKLNKYETSLKL